MRYRKKPVEVEAFQWQNPLSDIPGWALEALQKGRIVDLGNGFATIATPEGPMLTNPGDWIICGVKGELYPCRPDIFAMTYEGVA